MSAGLLAAFADADALTRAILRLRDVGYTALDAFTPYPVAEVSDALGERGDRMPWIAGVSMLGGAAVMLAVQWWAGAAYPLDVGGRSPVPWPAFVSTTVIVAILWAALGSFVGLLLATGLPRLHHPVFAVEGFERLWDERFFLLVEARDPRFDADATAALLAALGATGIDAA